MASRHLAPGVSGANIYRQWRACRADYRRARRDMIAYRGNEAPVDALLCDFYGCLCNLLLTPAPDLEALSLKLRLAATDIFSVEPGLAEIFAAFVADARRLIPQSNS
jgi:hypothetical protein